MKKLWKGVSVSDRSYAAWIDVYGYDFSLGQCIQRSVFRSDKERTKQPNEMVRTLFRANMANRTSTTEVASGA